MGEVCRDIRGVSLANSKPSVRVADKLCCSTTNLVQIEQNNLFHVREELKLHLQQNADNPDDPMAGKHLGLLVGYVGTAFQPTVEHLAALLAKNEITYDLLWALFEPNTEVYTTCQGTGASRCVLFNHCEERTEMDGSKCIYLETRYLNSNGKILGEVTTGIKIPYFRGTKQIEHLRAYPLRYHADKDKVRKELIQCGRTFVSLIGIHHRQYEGKAFFIDDEGEIVARHVKGRIMVDAICFQERMPNYPCPRVQRVKPKFSVLGRCDTIKLADINPTEVDEAELLICSPTVLGFCLSSKRFCSWFLLYIYGISANESQSSLLWPTSATLSGARARLKMSKSQRHRRSLSGHSPRLT
jgi:hypothetical protein